MSDDIKKISRLFELPGEFNAAPQFGDGHINDTYRLTMDQGGTLVNYTLQRVNNNVFKNPELVMDNMARVCTHLEKKYGGDPKNSRRFLRLIKSRDGRPFTVGPNGGYWRCYCFIENVISQVNLPLNMVYEAARAFGRFQRDLVDLPGSRLHDTIPDFHNTPKRVQNLQKAIAADRVGRAKEVQREIDFVLERLADTELLLKLHHEGAIPERITHNDTKLNNVLMDEATGKGVCVIDLDTVMPGLVHYDFGDMVRTGGNAGAEDERDLDKVFLRMDMFEQLLRGFMRSAGSVLNETECHYLPFSGKVIALEIGVRFLTDYLDGDRYFKIHREGHNLDRARSQFKLVSSIEENLPKMDKLVEIIGRESGDGQ